MAKLNTFKSLDDGPLSDFRKEKSAGFVKIPRALFTDPIWQEHMPYTKREALIDLFQLVSYSDNNQSLVKGKLISWQRNQYPTSVRFLAERWSRSKDWVTNTLDLFEDRGYVKRSENGGQTMIEVISVGEEQSTGHQNGQYLGQKAENSGHQSGHITGRVKKMGNTGLTRVLDSTDIDEADTESDAKPDEHKNSDQDSDKDKLEEDKEYKKRKEVEEGASAPLFSLKDEYKNVENTYEAIGSFISTHRPDFDKPYQDLWNLFAEQKGKSKVKEFSYIRKANLKTRLKEKSFDFFKILTAASESSYLFKPEVNWFGLDWVLKNDNNYIKILEGAYVNTKQAGAEEKKISPYQLAQDKVLKIFTCPLPYLEGNIRNRSICGDLPEKLIGADADAVDFIMGFLDMGNNPGYSHAECFAYRQEKRKALK